MAFTVDQLLISAERVAQLTTALATTTVPNPLAQLLTEAESLVADYTQNFTVADDTKLGWVRAIVLNTAYNNAGLACPEDIRKAFEKAQDELVAIATGKRPGLTPVTAAVEQPRGKWASRVKVL